MSEKLYSIAKAAELTGRKEVTLRRAALDGKIGHKLEGSVQWLFTQADVDLMNMLPKTGASAIYKKVKPDPKDLPSVTEELTPEITKKAPLNFRRRGRRTELGRRALV